MKKNNLTLSFGKYKGKNLETDISKIPTQYLIWLLSQSWLEDKHPKIYKYLISIEEDLYRDLEFDEEYQAQTMANIKC